MLKRVEVDRKSLSTKPILLRLLAFVYLILAPFIAVAPAFITYWNYVAKDFEQAIRVITMKVKQ